MVKQGTVYKRSIYRGRGESERGDSIKYGTLEHLIDVLSATERARIIRENRRLEDKHEQVIVGSNISDEKLDEITNVTTQSAGDSIVILMNRVAVLIYNSFTGEIVSADGRKTFGKIKDIDEWEWILPTPRRKKKIGQPDGRNQ